jgi:hypothetical protein
VLRLGELSQINERCLDLQRSKASSSRKAAALSTANTADGPTPDSSSARAAPKGVVGFMQQPGRQRGKQRQRQKKGGGCPFLSVEGGAAGWEEFADLVLAAPIDVEELASMGRRKKVGQGW